MKQTITITEPRLSITFSYSIFFNLQILSKLILYVIGIQFVNRMGFHSLLNLLILINSIESVHIVQSISFYSIILETVLSNMGIFYTVVSLSSNNVKHMFQHGAKEIFQKIINFTVVIITFLGKFNFNSCQWKLYQVVSLLTFYFQISKNNAKCYSGKSFRIIQKIR